MTEAATPDTPQPRPPLISLAPLSHVARQWPIALVACLGMAAIFYAIAWDAIGSDDADAAALVGTGAFAAAVIGHALRGWLTALVLAVAAAAAMGFADALLINRPLLMAALVVMALAAPGLWGQVDGSTYWRLGVRTVAAALLALLAAILVLGGVVALEFSAEVLLGVPGGDFAFNYALPFAAGLLGPIVFLALAPVRSQGPERIGDALGLVAQTLAQLVLTPLLALYALVLVAYVFRVIIEGELPSNEVGWIVPLFALTGILTFLATASMERLNRVADGFRRVWFFIMLPPVALFVIALWLRVDAYGLTDQRYLAMLAAVWFVAVGAAFAIGGWRSDVRLIPVSLALILGLGAVGPWSLTPMVVKSQTEILLAELPETRVAERLRAMRRRERQQLCSSATTLNRHKALDRVEADRRLADPGLLAICRSPWAHGDQTEIVRFEGELDAVRTEGPSMVWGPHLLYEGLASDITAKNPPMTLELNRTNVTLVHGGTRHVFDLAKAARDWREDPTPHAIVVNGEGVTLWINSLHISVAPDAAALSTARITVIVDHYAASGPATPASASPAAARPNGTGEVSPR